MDIMDLRERKEKSNPILLLVILKDLIIIELAAGNNSIL